jgi:hypothetical protein
MRKRSELPRNLKRDGFTVADAHAAGMSRKRTRAIDLETPFRGVRAVAGGEHDVRSRARAYAARMPPGQFFSHTTAALMLGIPLPPRLALPLRPGRKRVRGDLVYLEYRVLVEYDGEQHRTDTGQYAT